MIARRLQPFTRARRRAAAGAALLAAAPAALLAAAAWPCHCPAHQADAMRAMAMPPAHVDSAPAAMSTHAAMRMPMADAGGPAMRWVVGSERAPLVTRAAEVGPLALASAAGQATDRMTRPERGSANRAAGQLAADDAPAHVSAAPIAHAAAASGSATDPAATRAKLTTAQATARLSRRCRQLVKAKHPSRLSKADRRKRTACLAQRRKLIAASKAPKTSAESNPSTSPTPTPTPAPSTGTTTPPNPSATPAPTPTPAPGSTSPCAGKNPCYGAVGVTAVDSGSDLYFTLTRGQVMADRVSFEFTNTDSQDHNLYINKKGDTSTIKPVVADLAPQERTTVEMALAPGTYTLRCTVPGHESMIVDFVVQAPIR